MCCAAIAATSAAPKVPSRMSHSETGLSAASTAWIMSSSKLLRGEESGTVARKRTNCATIDSREKSRVQMRRYARLAMEGELYKASGEEANRAWVGLPGIGRGNFRKFRGNFL